MEEPSRFARFRASFRRLRRNECGAVFVEFLIAFLPVQVLFLCLIQSAILYSVKLVTEHAAVHAARAAAVVIGDEPSVYGGERPHVLTRDGRRLADIRKATVLTLAPLIVGGVIQSVDVVFPPADRPDSPGQTLPINFQAIGDRSVTKIRVRVEVDAACRIGFASQIVCASLVSFLPVGAGNRFFLPTRKVRAEAIYPYQGASYDY